MSPGDDSRRHALLDVVRSELTRAQRDIVEFSKSLSELKDEVQKMTNAEAAREARVERIERAAHEMKASRPHWALVAVTALGLSVSVFEAWTASRTAAAAAAIQTQAQPSAVVEQLSRLHDELKKRDATLAEMQQKIGMGEPAK